MDGLVRPSWQSVQMLFIIGYVALQVAVTAAAPLIQVQQLLRFFYGGCLAVMGALSQSLQLRASSLPVCISQVRQHQG